MSGYFYLVGIDFEGRADFEYVTTSADQALQMANSEFGGMMAYCHCWKANFGVYEKVREKCPREGYTEYLVRAEFAGCKGYVVPEDGEDMDDKAQEAAVRMLKSDIDPNGDKVVWKMLETDVGCMM